jgi:hypothetical protein
LKIGCPGDVREQDAEEMFENRMLRKSWGTRCREDA